MLVGLCGYPGSGKSEVRDILVNKYDFQLVDPKIVLRRMASALTGLHPDEFVTQEQKATLWNGVPRRAIMGEIGNSVERIWGDNFLISQALDYYRTIYPEENIVVDSLRKDQPRHFPGMVVQVISNKSREPQNDFDRFYQGRTNAIIINDGTLEELEETVKRVLWL